MTAPTLTAAGADEPFNWSDTGESHAPFCPHPFLCDGVCREVTEVDGATVVLTRPRGTDQLSVEIATPTSVVQLAGAAAAQVALLIVARTHRTT